MRTSDQIIITRRLAQALTAVIAQTPQGAPSGALYRPLAGYISPAEFAAMLRLLVATRRISKRGPRYFPASGLI
jgi:hypothetical protein